MVALEQKIDTFLLENEESVNGIIQGSDEHLDMINSIVKPLEEMAGKFEVLNELLFNNIQNLSDEKIRRDIMPKLKSLNRSCMTLIGAMRTSFLYSDVRTALKNYSKQHDILRELIHDIHHFRLTKDEEFDDLLKRLNKL